MEILEIRKNDIRKHKKNKAIHIFKSVKYSKDILVGYNLTHQDCFTS